MGLTAKQLMETATRTPKRGEWVDYFPLGANANDAESRPQLACVTRVFSPEVVNLQIFYDGASVCAKTSVARRGAHGQNLSCWDYMPDA